MLFLRIFSFKLLSKIDFFSPFLCETYHFNRNKYESAPTVLPGLAAGQPWWLCPKKLLYFAQRIICRTLIPVMIPLIKQPGSYFELAGRKTTTEI